LTVHFDGSVLDEHCRHIAPIIRLLFQHHLFDFVVMNWRNEVVDAQHSNIYMETVFFRIREDRSDDH